MDPPRGPAMRTYSTPHRLWSLAESAGSLVSIAYKARTHTYRDGAHNDVGPVGVNEVGAVRGRSQDDGHPSGYRGLGSDNSRHGAELRWCLTLTNAHIRKCDVERSECGRGRGRQGA